MENNQPLIYTEDQLMARLKFFIGVCLALTLTGIVFVVLYSLIFVTQPLNAISPIDQKFFELIVPIATFLTGTLSGIMLAGRSKDDQEAMLAAQKQAQANYDSAKTSTVGLQSAGSTPSTGGFGGGTSSGGFNTPSSGAATFGSPAAGGFGTSTPGFGAVPPVSTGFSAGGFGNQPSAAPVSADWTPQVVAGFGGKPAPVQPPQPPI